jgi:hypothetical protein
MVNPAEWEGKQAPPRKWIVENYIPDGTVTLLYADGGTGKSYLKLQLAIARAVAREWIGLMPEPGRTLVLSTEDDITEMWRRIEGMLPFFGARMADLGDIRLVDLGQAARPAGTTLDGRGSISKESRPAKAASPTKTCGPSKARKRTTAKSAVSLTSNGRMDSSAASSGRPVLTKWPPIKRPKTCSYLNWRVSMEAGAV